MIPKIIHMCWFGRSKKSELALRCINTWKQYCCSYRIIEWNEDNFDISSNEYVFQAYNAKKWAFVTDYVRLYALYNYGGVYMDTDVEVIKPINEFLNNAVFSGFECVDRVPTGIIGAEKGNKLVLELLNYYNDKSFINADGSLNLTTNVKTITDILVKHGLVLNNTCQTISGMTLYPNDFFCPKNYITGKITITNNTHTIHHYDGSWQTPKTKLMLTIRRILGQKVWNVLHCVKSHLHIIRCFI